FSETFIVNELLAHQSAGLDIDIFSLRAPIDGRFHEMLSRVHAPVTYLPHHGLKAEDLWERLRASATQSGFSEAFVECCHEDVDDVAQALTLAQLVRERGITHLHAHFGSVATTVARLASCFTGVPYSFTAHAKDLYHESVNPVDLQRKLATADAVVTVSDYNVRHLQTEFGPDAQRVSRIYNGVNLEQFPYCDPADRPQRIIAVGRLVEKKGFDVLIDACALMRDRGRDTECLIVGSGAQEAVLAERITQHGLESQVHLIGPRPQEAVIELIQNSAVFTAPCVIGQDGNRDGLPTVLIESMALGTPCVATDVTGIPELVRDGVTGLLVAQNDPVALADALERVLDDAVLRTNLATTARQVIERDFDITTNTAELRKLFTAGSPVQHSLEEVAV
ncbi:MAG: glycosyltransferase family 4 protein, partial [Chloroflexota bacterium]